MLILTTGEYVNARHACEMGLVAEVAPEGYALAHALDIARKITRHPTGAIEGMKKAVHAGATLHPEDALKVENEWFGKRWNSTEHRAAVGRFLGTEETRNQDKEDA